MKAPFFYLTILASTIRAIPVNVAHAGDFEKTGTASATVGKRQDNWDVERNELTNVAGVGCKPITVIYARGTIELGNVGDLVGPPFFNDLYGLIGADNIAVQGVDYPATIAGYLIGGDPGGAQTTADLLNQAAKNCPDTQIVLSGYSQGAMEVHLGEAMVGAEVAAQITAVVVFGDPFKGRPFPNVDSSKVMTYCFNDDFICDDLPVVDTYHLEYVVDTPAAARFVQGLVSP
ncbi:MAG: hypothetical protein Q9161_005752 [Pseudevernia consocians]